MSAETKLLLPRSEEITLRQIAAETWPCQCQFSPHDLAMLGARGFISIATCTVANHGRLALTPLGAETISGA